MQVQKSKEKQEINFKYRETFIVVARFKRKWKVLLID